MNRIRFLRMQKAIKQEDLARIIHVSQSSLSGYENEKYEPDKRTLLRLASYFGVSVDYLLGIDPVCHLDTGLKKKVPIYSVLWSEPTAGPCGSVLYFLDPEPYWPKNEEYFGVQVFGDMMEPRIFAGDIAIARRQENVASGEIAVIQVGHAKAEVIRVIKHESGLTLLPYNPKREAISYTRGEIHLLTIKILGKVIEFHGMC